jgi:hypothetical protein
MRSRFIPAALVAVAALVSTPAVAWAEASASSTANVDVGPMTSGPTVSHGSAGFNPTGTAAAASSGTATGLASAQAEQAGPGVSDITFRQIPFNAIPQSGVWVDQAGRVHLLPAIPANACPPGQTGFFTYDASGVPLGIVCVGAGNPAPGAPAPSPLALAQQASAAQPWPVLRFGVNPSTGLTGLASWFWLTGNPGMADATASAGPLTVRVHAALVDVDWSFGDGGSLSSGTDVGRPFPAPGSVRHVYQTDTSTGSAGYTLSTLLRYRVTFSVNGGPDQVLGVKARSFVTSYPVEQLQPQAVSAR